MQRDVVVEKSALTSIKRMAWQFLVAPGTVLLVHRKLIWRLTKREVLARYRGTMLGVLWSFLVPLSLLAIYTFVFSVVFKARWGQSSEAPGFFALILFCGLIAYNIFSESVVRAPTLMISNVSYIKKVVFPLEILPVVCMLGALFNGLVNFGVLLLAYSILIGLPPLATLLIPLPVISLCLFTLGVTFFLSSLGVYIRDLHQGLGVALTVVLFLSPIFYPITSLPENFRIIVLFNPLTLVIEQLRGLLFSGVLPNQTELLLSFTGAVLVWLLGFRWFMYSKEGFADVV